MATTSLFSPSRNPDPGRPDSNTARMFAPNRRTSEQPSPSGAGRLPAGAAAEMRGAEAPGWRIAGKSVLGMKAFRGESLEIQCRELG